MTLMLGLFAMLTVFLAFIALWLFVLAFLRASALDLPSDRTERAQLMAELAVQARALDGLGRHIAALDAELRRERPVVEILPPVERFEAASRAYRLSARGPVRAATR